MIENLLAIWLVFAITFFYMYVRIQNIEQSILEGTYKANIVVSLVEIIFINGMFALAAYIVIGYTSDIIFIITACLIAFFISFLVFNKVAVLKMGVLAVPVVSVLYVLGYYGMYCAWNGGM